MPCEVCGRDLTGRRRGARFCSDQHRWAAWKARRRTALAAVAEDMERLAATVRGLQRMPR